MPRHNPKFLDSIVSLERRFMAFIAIGLLCVLAFATILLKSIPFLIVVLLGAIACYLLALISISVKKERRGFILQTTEYDLSVQRRIDLLNSASRSIIFVTGPFLGEFWNNVETLRALESAAQRGVSIRGIWGSDKDNRNEEFLGFAKEIGINLIEVDAFPKRHFILTDSMNVRWENCHPENQKILKQDILNEVTAKNTMIYRDFVVGLLCRLVFFFYKICLRKKKSQP